MKRSSSAFVVALLPLTMLGCVVEGTDAGGMEDGATLEEEVAPGVFYDGHFDTGAITNYTQGTTSLCCSHSATFTSWPVRRGARSIKFSVNRWDPEPAIGSHRAEFQRWGESASGDERWYGFSIFIPTSWQNDTPAAMTTVAQWHSNTDPGEATKSPHLGLNVKVDRWLLGIRWDANKISTASTIHKSEIDLGSIVKGKWTDWVVHAKWSYGGDGHLEVWKDGIRVVNRFGPNEYNDGNKHFFKYGIYEWPWSWPSIGLPEISVTNKRELYFDEVRMGYGNAGYAAVNPGG